MRTKAEMFYAWLCEYRMHICLCLLVVAGVLLMQRSETRTVPELDLSGRDVTVAYVGPLETVVSRSGINHGNTKLDGGFGFGLGIQNDMDRASP